MSEVYNPGIEREAILSDVLAGLGAIAQAGFEQDLSETKLRDLEAETTDRARELYQQTVEE